MTRRYSRPHQCGYMDTHLDRMVPPAEQGLSPKTARNTAPFIQDSPWMNGGTTLLPDIQLPTVSTVVLDRVAFQEAETSFAESQARQS